MAESGKQRRGRPPLKGQSLPSEDELLQQILSFFANNGYEGSSLRQLAKQLGVSHNFLNIRFGTKEQIWRKAVDHACNQLYSPEISNHLQRRTAVPVQEQLSQALIAILMELSTCPELLQLVNSEGFEDSERLRYIFSRFPIDTSTLKKLLDKGIGQGVFKEVDLPVLFLLIMHGGGAVMCMRPLGSYIGLNAGRSQEELRQQARVVVDTLLNGLIIKR